ncbi:hypothetical protein PV325_011035 [Microctonus aethiopoides]|uniref:Bifunctional peptidase and (3S)-lysyl hydroxylase JMJD7 n=1 Tax=Microctonus aethiopoides TaxID=144406 RepID=A0AA39FP73_9HYME|nr:hypothetical protein PV325_011035 [Microctonus aethiopoides]KAK0173265.1 hypothetical protein PV328_006489 [Microctonus aethiopoides]
MASEEFKIERACQLLSKEARELYLPTDITEINAEKHSINAFEFYRNYVSRNIPLLIKNGVSKWPAVNKWNISYFRQTLPDKSITVAVTPNGYADAISSDNSSKEYFVMPEERELKMSSFLDKLENPDTDVYYIQQQNSNFQNYYHELWRDVERHIPWATEAFGKDPDAINFWMGDKRAITSMHKDPYENIYCVISGEKEFILHPPTDLPWIPHSKYPSAQYKINKNGKWNIIPISTNRSNILDDDTDDENLIPWISINPLEPNYEKYPQYKRATTLRVKVEAGDILYLPSLWFHHVQQSHACIAINYWYDMDYDIKYSYFKSLEILCQ